MRRYTITSHEAAERLGVDHSQVCRYCQQGILESEKISGAWFISSAALASFKRPRRGNPNFYKEHEDPLQSSK